MIYWSSLSMIFEQVSEQVEKVSSQPLLPVAITLDVKRKKELTERKGKHCMNSNPLTASRKLLIWFWTKAVLWFVESNQYKSKLHSSLSYLLLDPASTKINHLKKIFKLNLSETLQIILFQNIGQKVKKIKTVIIDARKLSHYALFFASTNLWTGKGASNTSRC